MQDIDADADADLKLTRASGELIESIYELLEVILWKRAGPDGEKKVHRYVKHIDLGRLLQRIEPFQADPQLLDPHLSFFVTELWTAYLKCLAARYQITPTQTWKTTISIVIGKVLYTLCKIRGEKVIVGILNNEPKHLEPLVLALEKASANRSASSWEERYVLLLWLALLLLAPFDLASISTADEETKSLLPGLELPLNVPGIPRRLVPVVLNHLYSPTKEQNAAATMLVRLCLRPDMLKLGLLDSIVKYVIQIFQRKAAGKTLYESLGNLQFLSRLLASGNIKEIGHVIPQIHEVIQAVMLDESLETLRLSAVVRKLVIKMTRHLAIKLLSTEIDNVDPESTLEEAIGFFLSSLGDNDTPVRMAASKSLSQVTMQLDPDTGADVLEAILGGLSEDVLWDNDQRNMAAVDPLRWHGLTLTLSHLLFRRALPVTKLPETLNALLLALTFEQRSATGTSIGTNVRDAANFGVWSLARRYTTLELEAIDTSTIRAAATTSSQQSAIHLLAIELIQSACLDPAGNVRRGSSAALQELIGRHQGSVPEGIALVQIVDYHGVSLRGPAMKRAVQATTLHKSYWTPVFEAFRGWRGLGAPDMISRAHAAESISCLGAADKGASAVILNCLLEDIQGLPKQKVEDRHGILVAMSSLLNASVTKHVDADLWQALGGVMSTPKDILPEDAEAYRVITRRPEITAGATLQLVAALCNTFSQRKDYSETEKEGLEYFLDKFERSIRRSDASVLELIPQTLPLVIPYIQDLEATTKDWISAFTLEAGPGNRMAGLVLALGIAQPHMTNQKLDDSHIVSTLISRCSPPVEVEGRVLALKSLHQILLSPCSDSETYTKTAQNITDAVLIGLNDTTVDERGDVGSLVRIQALDMVEDIWRLHVPFPADTDETLYSIVLRLSLEKLDRVRVGASKALKARDPDNSLPNASAEDVDTLPYFAATLGQFYSSPSVKIQRAILEGYCSTAGMGSDVAIQLSREALSNWLTQVNLNKGADRIFSFLTVWMDVLQENLKNDRVSLPLLETLAFLGDFGALFAVLIGDRFINLLSLVQKSHFKTSNIPKILAALEVYRALAEVEQIQDPVRSKIKNMLLHPFPKVRSTAAETLHIIRPSAALKDQDWSQPVAQLKKVVSGLEI
ncbi:hypothetical protein BT63DRAFT_468368 [Microthyrium microscopicum]|uniref:Uncharacterized protein n=1 Tax=Microthyrium microscopicum TaxID=703497 RepID=A0A6A6ULP4_9PEZI|nr:hypothetical protein BT63DRAFT_468368 [Microthyrium microscopicum]